MDEQKHKEISWKVALQLFFETTFILHLLIFLGFIVQGAFFCLPWIIVVFIHGILASSLISRLFGWTTPRDAEHENLNLQVTPKPNRIELGADGELIEYFEDETEAKDDKQRSGSSE